MAIEITELKKRATMINDKVRMYLLPPLFNAAVRAGASIMNIYKNLDDYDISLKDDKTPITLADRLAHKTIREYLGRTRIPILSEEGREMRYDERRNWELYWLVDPLDGTVEFIKGNNEFTVNIALMENNVCMGAVIYVPYFEKMYVAGRDSGSYVKEHIAPDAAAEYTYDQIVTGWRQLPPARDDLVVGVFGGGIRRDMLLDVGTRIAPGDVHLFEIGDINDRPHADVVLHQGDIHGKFVVSLDEFDRSVERIDQPVQLPVTAFVVAHLAALLTQDRDARAAQIFADGFVC